MVLFKVIFWIYKLELKWIKFVVQFSLVFIQMNVWRQSNIFNKQY